MIKDLIWVGRFAKIGFANGGAKARITDDCKLVRIHELGLGSGGCGSGRHVGGQGGECHKVSTAALAHCQVRCQRCKFRSFASWCELRIINPGYTASQVFRAIFSAPM